MLGLGFALDAMRVATFAVMPFLAPPNPVISHLPVEVQAQIAAENPGVDLLNVYVVDFAPGANVVCTVARAKRETIEQRDKKGRWHPIPYAPRHCWLVAPESKMIVDMPFDGVEPNGEPWKVFVEAYYGENPRHPRRSNSFTVVY